MRYIKRFEINENLRKDGEYYYIDNINDESHILFPVIDILNSGLQENIDTLLDSMYKSSDYINGIFRKNKLDNKKRKEIELIAGFLQSLQYQHEDGDLTDDQVEKFIHDIVIDGKIPIKLAIGGYNRDYDEIDNDPFDDQL
mgnify:FL=1